MEHLGAVCTLSPEPGPPAIVSWTPQLHWPQTPAGQDKVLLKSSSDPARLPDLCWPGTVRTVPRYPEAC